ncbi:MAG: hydantoinase/oxoprolinase N-terminal domain-containing protein, partial [Thermoanaerobaculia bacterium]
MTGTAWRIWIDTGGTFTDCLAVDPGGRLHRAKVLSTSALRGRIAERLGPATLRVEAGWSVPDRFLHGFAFRLLGGSERKVIRQTGMLLELDGPVEEEGTAFELRSPEEPPVLAARLVTGTPLGRELPEIALRLA